MDLTQAIAKPDVIDRLADIEQCICDRGFSILVVRNRTNPGYGKA